MKETELYQKRGIPVIDSNTPVWFCRPSIAAPKVSDTELIKRNMVGIGWSLIRKNEVTIADLPERDKKELLLAAYPEEKQPCAVYDALNIFFCKMKLGDYVVVPYEGGRYIALGKIAGNPARECLIDGGNDFINVRKVEWVDTAVDTTVDLFYRGRQGQYRYIRDIRNEREQIFRNVYPVCVSDKWASYTIKRDVDDAVLLAELKSILECVEEIEEELKSALGVDVTLPIEIRVAVGSPGFVELIINLAGEYLGSASSVLTAGLMIILAGNVVAETIIVIVKELRKCLNDANTGRNATRESEARTGEINAQARLANAQAEAIEIENAEKLVKLADKLAEEEKKFKSKKEGKHSK